MKRIAWCVALAAAIVAAGCSSDDDPKPDNGGGGNGGDKQWVEDDPDDYLSSAVFDKQVTIRYDGSSADVKLPNDAILVRKDGAHVVIDAATNAVSGVEIVLSGSTEDGSLKIYAAKKVKLTLDGVELTSKRGAAVNNQSSKRTFVYLAAGKKNLLADAAVYDDTTAGEDSKGCLFSEGQLLFSGAGTLQVLSAAKHGIASDEYVRMFEGKVTAEAGKDAVHANDYVRIDGGDLDLTAGSDGIEVERGFIHLLGGNVAVRCGGDGVKASGKAAGDHAPYVEISGGRLSAICTGEKSKGVEAAQDLMIKGGTVTAEVSGAAGKCLKATGNVLISGGSVELTATGDGLYASGDTSSAACIRSDNGVTLSGGTVRCTASGSGGKAVNALRMNVTGGELTASATGTAFESNGLKASPKAIKLDGDATVAGGSLLAFSAADDAFAAAGKITVQGGRTIAVAAAGKDSFSAAGGFVLSGGEVVGTGGDATVPSASSAQRTVLVRGTDAAKDELLYVTGADGKTVVAYRTPVELADACFLFGNPDLAEGACTLYAGGTVQGGQEWQGLVSGGTAQGGRELRSFTISSTVTEVGAE